MTKERTGLTVTGLGHEISLDQELRHSALKVFAASGGINELLVLRSRMLQEISGAILAAYVEKYGSPPTPAEVQRMRQLALSIWDDIAGTKYRPDLRDEK